MRIEDIMHENGDFWVGKVDGTYTVLQNGDSYSLPDSSYPMDDDGLSLAKYRCDYLAKTVKNPRERFERLRRAQ